MAPVFSKEAILQGSIDHLCLVCESYLKSERDVRLHVATAEHTQNLHSTDYVEKYRHDRVRKVKSWYFCEFCNVVLLTRSSVKLHVVEPKHEQYKSFQSMARVGDVIISRNATIQEKAWHGFIDEKTCVICDVECEDQEEHKREPSHVINLIQSKVTDEDNVYRMIDDSTFQCLTCNEIVPEITTHLEDEKHNEILQQCSRMTLFQQSKENSPNDYCRGEKKTEKSCIEDKDQCCEKIEEYTAETSNINESDVVQSFDRDSEIIQHHEENDMSTSVELDNTEDSLTREGKTTFNIPVFDNSDSGIVNVETRPNVTEGHADHISGIRKQAEEYGLIYNATNNKTHCPICNKRIPSSMTNVIEHVNGEQHKNNTRSQNQLTISKQNNHLKVKKCNSLRVPITLFIISMQPVNILQFQDIVLNKTYCIGYYCFTFLTKLKDRQFRCQVCEVTISNQEIEEHVKLGRHVRALMEVPVIIYDASEFIREIRSDIFQCGFCNIVDSWDGMELHLQSTLHKQKKLVAGRRLVKYSSIEKRHYNKYSVRDGLSVLYSLHDNFK